MKATLQYNLPDEKEDFELAMNATKLHGLVGEFDSWLRSEIKYEDHPEVKAVFLQEIRDKLWEIAKGQGLDLW